MITGWIVAIVALLGILGVLIRLTYQVGLLVQKFGDHVSQSEKTFADQELRLRALERARKARVSGGHT